MSVPKAWCSASQSSQVRSVVAKCGGLYMAAVYRLSRHWLSSGYRSTPSGAAIQFGHHELAMAQRFCRREASIGRARDHFDHEIARLVDGQLATHDARHIDV